MHGEYDGSHDTGDGTGDPRWCHDDDGGWMVMMVHGGYDGDDGSKGSDKPYYLQQNIPYHTNQLNTSNLMNQ